MKRSSIVTILCILVLIGSYYIYSNVSWSGRIPHNAPKTVIKYNEKTVPTSFGAQCWINSPTDNGDDVNDKYSAGLKTPKFNAKAGDKLHISIPKKPLKVTINRIIDSKYTDYSSNQYTPSQDKNEYLFTLPTEKGEYIFIIHAEWDKYKHNTAAIFRVVIE